MRNKLIVALLAALVASGPALAQNPGERRGGDPRPPRLERRDEGGRQPEADRRSRIDRAERTIRERRSQQRRQNASPSDTGDGMIYRRSNSYRRW